MADDLQQRDVGDGVGVGVGAGQVDPPGAGLPADGVGLVGPVGVELEFSGVAPFVVDDAAGGDVVVGPEVLGQVGDDLHR
jgi:hypothetical protein